VTYRLERASEPKGSRARLKVTVEKKDLGPICYYELVKLARAKPRARVPLLGRFRKVALGRTKGGYRHAKSGFESES
jgi:hypothetical protein